MQINPNVHAINTPDPAAREKFLRDAGITMTWEYTGGDPAKNERINFRFVLRRRGREDEPPVVWEEMSFFSGPGNFPRGTPLVPQVESFLECVRSDCTSIRHNETFENFVDEMGMNDNAKEAVRIWAAIEKQWAQLRRLLGEEKAQEFVDMEIEDEWR